MPLQRSELYPFFQKHAIPTEAHFKELIDSMLNLEDDGVSKPPDAPLSIKAFGTDEGLINFYPVDGGTTPTWQFKQKPGEKAGLSIHDAAADATPSRLFIESGTGNVGIGTTEPGAMLEVAGLIKAEGVIFPDGTEQTTATTSGLWTQNGLKIHYNDGNVGIGTTDPGAKLHILGSNPVLQLDHNVANQGTATIQFTHVAGGSNQRKVAMISEATGSWCRGHLHLAVNIKGDTSDVAIGDAKLTIRGDTGNVGIGTTEPGEKLEVAGVMKATDGVLINGNRSSHLNADGALYRYGGQVYIVVDDNLYIRDNSTPDVAKFHFQTDTGKFTATSKSFKISHPTRPDYDLTHGCVEGPELAVYYRGEAHLVDGRAVITLPGYFDALTRPGTYTVQLTPQGTEPFLLSYADFAGGSFHVYGSKPNGAFAWEVKAIRADVDPLEVETLVEEPEKVLA